MISFSEYNQQKLNVKRFERTVSLAIAHMKGIADKCDLSNASISTFDGKMITLRTSGKGASVRGNGASVFWSDLQRFMRKGKWVVEFKDNYCNREYRIFDTKRDANEEYRELASRAGCDIDWVEEPTSFSWEELAELDPDDLRWY